MNRFGENLGFSSIYVFLIILLFAASSLAQSLPENASPNAFGSDWQCNRGYYKTGQKCLKIQIPENASLNFFGNDWQCNRGYYKAEQKCLEVQIPENASLNFFGNNWQCNRGYKKSNNSCVPMSQRELQRQKELMQALLAASQRRKDQGVSGDDCDREYKTNAEVCVKLTRGELDCNESYNGDHYRACDATINYNIETDYQGGSYIDADVECRVEIEYRGRGIYSTRSDSGTRDESHSLYAYDSDRERMVFNFTFGHYEEITSVKIASANCSIDSLNLY